MPEYASSSSVRYWCALVENGDREEETDLLVEARAKGDYQSGRLHFVRGFGASCDIGNV